MDDARWEQLQAIFHEAASLPESEWAEFLDSRCAGDEDLKTELLGMLRSDKDTGTLLNGSMGELAREAFTGAADGPRFKDFGPYCLTGQKLGEGGMGSVWLAKRKDVGNFVAIKFLTNAVLAPDRRERFAQETYMLSRLKHPFIARFCDAGTLPDQTPWFAMDYVEGKLLEDYCRRPSTIPERLQLFRSICEAVQYAHGQEIIHRDLKPSNILVEADGTPRVLDFGIAKQLHAEQPQQDFTRPGARMLTPEYAAPEWIRDGNLGPYTDVYSLGVILYEMLTGARHAETGPQKPSLLAKPLFGPKAAAWNDLDLLCLTAMHPDVGKRYRSVEALLRDVDHYLNSQPLDAKGDNLRYRAGKFIVRHRRAVTAGAIGVSIVASLATAFAIRLAKARSAELAEAAKATRVEQYLLNLFDGGDKAAGASQDLRVVTMLDRGVEDAQELSREPAVQAEVYQTLGIAYQRLGQFGQSGRLLQSALDERKSVFGTDSPQVADTMIAIGLLRIDEANLADAEKIIRNAIHILEGRVRPQDPTLMRAQVALGKVLEERGQYRQAMQILDAAVQSNSTNTKSPAGLLSALTELADAHFYLGDYAGADSLNRQALKLDEQIYGDRHPRIARDWLNLSQIQSQQGHYAQSEAYARRAMRIDESWYGKQHPDTANAESYVAQQEIFEGHYREAEQLLEEALGATELAYGGNHPRVALILNSLGTVHLQLKRPEEAEADFNRVLQIYRTAYGDGHLMTATALANLGSVYLAEKRYAKAESMFRDVILRDTRALSADHVNTGIARIKLGRTLLLEKRYREAQVETLAGYRIVNKQEDPSVSWLKAARGDPEKEGKALGAPETNAQPQQFARTASPAHE